MRILYKRDFAADPNLLPPSGRHPYYIVTPRYTRMSAGIRCLHYMCHCLNNVGQSAFILFCHDWQQPNLNPELVTPVLNGEISDYHFREGLTPITVYPEVVSGNPYNAPVRVRFLGNFPGLLGGDKIYDANEICFGHSKVLAKTIGCPKNVLFVPSIDTRMFQPNPRVTRKGTCFSASKYQDVHGGKVFGIPPGCVEITRDKEASPTPAQIAELFRKSELFYCFENTALAIEAALCECPVVLMFNEFFSIPLAVEELGWDGFACSDNPAEIERARRTVGNVFQNYANNVDIFWDQLDQFIKVTQTRAVATQYTQRMNVEPILKYIVISAVKPDPEFHVSISLLGMKFLFLVRFRREKALMRFISWIASGLRKAKAMWMSSGKRGD